jgi:hypothetical protein
MTPTNPPDPLERASDRAMFFDRLDHVLGATRTKTALAHEQWTDRSLVESHQRNQDPCKQAIHRDDSQKPIARKIYSPKDPQPKKRRVRL